MVGLIIVSVEGRFSASEAFDVAVAEMLAVLIWIGCGEPVAVAPVLSVPGRPDLRPGIADQPAGAVEMGY